MVKCGPELGRFHHCVFNRRSRRLLWNQEDVLTDKSGDQLLVTRSRQFFKLWQIIPASDPFQSQVLRLGIETVFPKVDFSGRFIPCCSCYFLLDAFRLPKLAQFLSDPFFEQLVNSCLFIHGQERTNVLIGHIIEAALRLLGVERLSLLSWSHSCCLYSRSECNSVLGYLHFLISHLEQTRQFLG